MEKLLKRFVLYVVITAILLSVTSPVFAASPNDKCKIMLNGQSVEWKLEPFLAYAPQGNAIILIPMKDFFTTLDYTVTYDSKLNRSVFTANKNSDYISFYVDIKTGQILKEGEEVNKSTINCAYLINDNLYVMSYGFSGLNNISTFLNNAEIRVEYNYIYSKHEDFIVQYSDYFPIPSNLFSLEIEISAKYPDHPYVGEQYTKYNTGEWISGEKVRAHGINNSKTKGFWEDFGLKEWDGFDSLHFFTGKGEKNELTGKTYGGSYAIAWELMDAVAEEINRLRKENGLSELAVDNSLCFVRTGAENSKVNTVFDNAIHNLENSTSAHTSFGKIISAECITSCPSFGEKTASMTKYDNSTLTVAKKIANSWYKSSKGHREIIMSKKYKTMGVLVVITDNLSTDSYVVFK